jgi:hypothetical protein
MDEQDKCNLELNFLNCMSRCQTGVPDKARTFLIPTDELDRHLRSLDQKNVLPKLARQSRLADGVNSRFFANGWSIIYRNEFNEAQHGDRQDGLQPAWWAYQRVLIHLLAPTSILSQCLTCSDADLCCRMCSFFGEVNQSRVLRAVAMIHIRLKH